MSEILQKFVSALEIKGGNDYIIRYSTDERVGLGYSEVNDVWSALCKNFPNNEFIFIPADCEIKNFDIETLKEIKEFIENQIKEKEEA